MVVGTQNNSVMKVASKSEKFRKLTSDLPEFHCSVNIRSLLSQACWEENHLQNHIEWGSKGIRAKSLYALRRAAGRGAWDD